MSKTRIAFFSDDASGTVCAQMVARALDRLDGRSSGEPPDHGDAAPVRSAGGLADIEAAMRRASREGRDLVVSLPLGGIGDKVLRRRFDVAVAVGDGQGPAARALRAARYDTAEPGSPGVAPVWFLARADQSVLMTKARLAASHGPRLPYGTRALPMMLPRIGPGAVRRLLAGEPDEGVMAGATLLAALLLAIAARPAALRLDAAELAGMMAARELPRERALAERLVGLAAEYERLAEGVGDVGASAPTVRLRDRRPIAGSAAKRIAPARHDRLSRWG